MLAVSDVTPEVFELVLEFVYSGTLRLLVPKWLKATNAELLFEAADWYLMPLFKVSAVSGCCVRLHVLHAFVIDDDRCNHPGMLLPY